MTTSDSLHGLLEAAKYHFEQNRPLLPMYLHLLVSALFPIYTGAHASLSRPSSAAKPKKRSDDGADKDDDEDDDDEEETIQKMEGLSPKDAIIFPITAGIVLASLYFAIKRYGADLINLVLGGYFSLIGTYSVAKLINDSWTTIESFVAPTYYRDQGKIWKVSNTKRKTIALDVGDGDNITRASPFAGPLGRLPLPQALLSLAWMARDLTKQKFHVKGYAKNVFDFRAVLTRHNVLSTVAGVSAIGYSIFVGKPWWLTNLQGFAVSYGALQLMSPTTFATGTLILSGLFFYDIWAVFYTPLMVTVAKNLDVPIKLVFPRPDEPSSTPGEPPVRTYSMLGLGDIVLPGLMIALALRFDLFMFYLRKQKAITEAMNVDDYQKKEDQIVKVPYVTATGHWGDRFWITWLASRRGSSPLPAHLNIAFPKPYFFATLVGYVVGMMATLIFMSVFQHAQPALLYLVPTVLVSLWGTGMVRGELKHMWDFSEALTLEPEDDMPEKSHDQKKDDRAEAKPFFSQLWSEFFGGEEQEKPKKFETEDHSTGSDTGSNEAQRTSENKDATSNAKDMVFSFTISHFHAKDARADAKNSNSKSDKGITSGSKAAVKGKKVDSSSDSLSEDTVLVSAADLDRQ